MTVETIGLLVGVPLAVALGLLVAHPRRDAVRFDARRGVWRFRTSAGTFRAVLGFADHKGRCYVVTIRYRDGRTVTGYCAPAEQILRRYIENLTRIYHEERVA